MMVLVMATGYKREIIEGEAKKEENEQIRKFPDN